MSATLTASEAFAQVQSSAEAIRNDAFAEIATASPGDVGRQGDVYLVLLDELPEKQGPYAGRQLAPGTTQGSRHVVEGDCELYTPKAESATRILHRLVPATKRFPQILGPTIVAKSPWIERHPEHGDRQWPAGPYQVTYQRAYADTLRAQRD